MYEFCGTKSQTQRLPSATPEPRGSAVGAKTTAICTRRREVTPHGSYRPDAPAVPAHVRSTLQNQGFWVGMGTPGVSPIPRTMNTRSEVHAVGSASTLFASGLMRFRVSWRIRDFRSSPDGSFRRMY